MNDEIRKRLEALKQQPPVSSGPGVPPPGQKQDSPPPPAPSSADLTMAKLMDLTGQLNQVVNRFDKAARILEQRLNSLPGEIQKATQPTRAEALVAREAFAAIYARLDGVDMGEKNMESIVREGFARNHIVIAVTLFVVFAVLCCVVLK
jgi:hypothetical protein